MPGLTGQPDKPLLCYYQRAFLLLQLHPPCGGAVWPFSLPFPSRFSGSFFGVAVRSSKPHK